MSSNTSNTIRQRRRKSIRLRVVGSAERPRMTVYRSAKHIYAQVIDDVSGKSLAAASTQHKTLAADLEKCGSKTERAGVVGKAIAAACEKQGIKQVVFDRNGYQYRGSGKSEKAKPTRVAALAEAARSAGLSF